MAELSIELSWAEWEYKEPGQVIHTWTLGNHHQPHHTVPLQLPQNVYGDSAAAIASAADVASAAAASAAFAIAAASAIAAAIADKQFQYDWQLASYELYKCRKVLL